MTVQQHQNAPETARSADMLVEKGLTHFENGRLEKAFELFEQAISCNPQCARGFCARGMVWQRRNDLGKAIADYEIAIHLDGRYARAFFNRGVAKHTLGDLRGAIQDFSIAIGLEAEARFYFQRGLARKAVGEYSTAIGDFTLAIKLSDPTEAAHCYLQRGIAHFQIRAVANALNDFRRACALKTDLVESHLAAATSFVELGDMEAAIEELRRIDPTPATLPFMNALYAHICYKSGRFSESLAHCDRVPETSRYYVAVLQLRGLMAAGNGDFLAAVDHYTRALACYPECSDTRSTLFYRRGVAHQKLGDLEAARFDIDEAIRISPTQACFYVRRGKLRAAHGDMTKALEDFDQAIRLDRSNASAYRARGRLSLVQGCLKEAQVDFAIADSLKPATCRINRK